MTERTRRLKKQIMERGGSFIAAEEVNPYIRDAALYKAWKNNGMSRVQIRAAMQLELVRLAPVMIPPEWRLAGEHLPLSLASISYLPFGFLKLKGENASEKLAALGIAGEETEKVRACVELWTAGRPLSPAGEFPEERKAGLNDWGCDSRTVFWARGWIENHSVRDYGKAVRLGWAGIQAEVEAELNSMDFTAPEYIQRENFLRAALYVCRAGVELTQKYADAAERAIGTASGTERERLSGMAKICRGLSRRGAQNFAEAAQALWLAHILTCGEDGINANSIGRLDQFLFPYYKSDIEKGLITRHEAVEIMEELACKMYLTYDVQAITLSGLDKNGSDATNELTYVILEATENMGFIRDLSVRLTKNSPQKLIDTAAAMIAKGGGIPFIFNDDCFVKALSDRGVAVEDARDYAPIGCVELTIPGKANSHAVSGWINALKCLELALFNGSDPQTGSQTGPRTGDFAEMRSFEEFFDAYKRQIEYFTRNMVYFCGRGELLQRDGGPMPCWSVLTDDCVKRGRDITDNGCVYNWQSVCFLGTADTADSLAAIKKLIFEDEKISKTELLAALKNNFKGHEKTRLMLLKDAPKYGNDQDYTDLIAKELAEHFITYVDGFKTPMGGRFFVHLFSFLCNLTFGKGTGATPDGRFAGEPLAYSLSAHQGRDEEGVTAMLKSLSKLPHSMAAGASAAIIDLSPSLIKGGAGVVLLGKIIRTAINMGVGQLQFNVVTAERLRQAKADPEKFGNIPVRVAGYSQLFKLLNPELQDHVIARTKHSA